MKLTLLYLVTTLTSLTLCDSSIEFSTSVLTVSQLQKQQPNNATDLKLAVCDSNPDCNYPHGYCVSSECSCRLFYSGTHCENDWKQNNTFNGLYNAYAAWVILSQFVCVVIAAYQLYITFKHATAGKWIALNITTYQLGVILAAGIVRMVSYAVDPRGYRGIVGPVADEFLFNLSVIMWLCAAFMTFLYWMELQTASIKELLSLSKYRPYLISFLIICMIVIVPVSLWRAIANTPLSFTLYMGSLGVLMLVFIFLASISGFNLIRVIKLGHRKLVFGSDAMNQFVHHMIVYIVTLDVLLASILLTLIIYLLIQTGQNMWKFIVMNWLLRTEEFLLILCSLWFIRKRKPKTPSDHTNSADGRTRSDSLASREVELKRTASQSSFKASLSSFATENV